MWSELLSIMLVTASVSFGAPLAGHADDLADDAACVARVGRSHDCRIPIDGQTVIGTNALPPGLEIAPDGRLTGTPTTSGIYSTELELSDRSTKRVQIPVSDVEYLAATLSSDGDRIVATRWDGTQTALVSGLKNGVVDVTMTPDGTVWFLTAKTLERIIRPGQVQVVVRGLDQARAMSVAPSGEIHIAQVRAVVTYDPATGDEYFRGRELHVSDVVEDQAGDLWTIEAGKLFRQDVATGEVTQHPIDGNARVLARNGDTVFVAVEGRSAPAKSSLIAVDRHGATAVLEHGTLYLTVAYSDLFGLVAGNSQQIKQFRWTAPLDASRHVLPTARRMTLAEHITHRG